MAKRKRDAHVDLTRRELMKVSAAGALLALGGGFVAQASQPKQQLLRRIPHTGELIPAMGLGTSITFDVGSSPEERAPLREVLRLFVEMGGKAIDSSPMYGRAETVIGDLAAELGVQQSLFLATKVWTEGRGAGIRQMENSFQRLRTARMDLMQVHNLVDVQTHLKTLRAWKEQGRIRYVGITHYTVRAYEALERLMKNKEMDFVQLNYSIETREAEKRLLPLAQDRGIAILANRPFEKAGLFGKVRGASLPEWTAEFDCQSWAQYFLKFLLAHPAVTCVIPATSKPKHLVDNMQAGLGRLPDEKTRAKMIAYLESL